MVSPTKVVILAAGKSTRMKSAHSKMVHKILGKEIINILIDAFLESGIPESDLIVVTGKDDRELRKVIPGKVTFATQEKQLGTAHALLSAGDHLKNFRGNLVVSVGDNPHLSDSDIRKLLTTHRSEKAQCTLLSAVFPHDPPPYGRILRDRLGNVTGVVEEMDASPDQRRIREVNSSVYVFSFQQVAPLLSEITNHNRKEEYYLTDIVGIMVGHGLKVSALIADHHWTSMGINTRWDLQQAEKRLNQRIQRKLALEKGVTILKPETVTIEFGVEIGSDTTVFPSSYIASGTTIGRNCGIGPFVFLKNTAIPDNSRISFKKIARER